jgi:putative membrane protein
MVGNIARFQFNCDEILMLLYLVIGCAAGLGAFVHLLNYLIKNYYNLTVAALIGFMVGAIPRIWPWQQENILTNRISYEIPALDAAFAGAVACSAAGLLLVLIIEFFARKRNQEQQ